MDKFKRPSIDKSSIVYALIPVVAFFLSNLLFKNLIGKIDSKLTLEEKIAPYQSASIVRWVILEGSTFMILFLKPDF